MAFKPPMSGGGGSGTVTDVSVVSANGFAGTVANSTTTPAITLTTTATGVLQGNGTAIAGTTLTDGQLLIGSTGNPAVAATLTAGTNVTITNAAGSITINATGGGGDVVGPASATDNAIARYDGTTGKLIQDSVVIISDTGDVTGVNALTMASIFTQESDAGFNLFRTINHNATPNPIWRSQTTRGTAATPTASQTSDVLLYIAARGYGATTDGGDRAYILAQCSENWTDSAQGASLSFAVTPTGGTSTTSSLIIQNSGQLQALSGSAAVPEYSFLSDTNTGIFSVGADSLGVSVGGMVRYTQTTTTGTLASRIVISPVATTSSTALRVNTASNTNQSFSTADIYFNVSAAKTFTGSGSGALFQGAIYVDIPDWTGSYSTSTTSVLHFGGPATLTGISGDNYVIYIDSGYSSLGDAIQMLTTGTASFPSYSWQTDSNTGMYRTGADSIGLSTGGTNRVTINNTAVTLTIPLRTGDGSASAPSHSFDNDTDCGMYRITSNRFGFSSNGVLALQFDTSTVTSAAGAVLDRVNIPAQTITITGSTNITTATGLNLHNIGIPTYSAASALTVTNAATVYIAGAPVGAGGGPATITNAYSFWVDAGTTRLDGNVQMPTDSSSITMGTTGPIILGHSGSDGFTFTVGGTSSLFIRGQQLRARQNASAAFPYFTWDTDPDTGLYRIGTNNFGASAGGVLKMDWSDVATKLTATRFLEAKGADVASANDLTLGTDGNTFGITGTTQINAITTANWQAGSHICLIFAAATTVKNNTAGGGGTAVMLLAGSADLTTAANTVLGLVYDGTQWQETYRKVA